MELPTGLSVVPGPAGGEGCSLEGGCASCPYMKMNSLQALMTGVLRGWWWQCRSRVGRMAAVLRWAVGRRRQQGNGLGGVGRLTLTSFSAELAAHWLAAPCLPIPPTHPPPCSL